MAEFNECDQESLEEGKLRLAPDSSREVWHAYTQFMGKRRRGSGGKKIHTHSIIGQRGVALIQQALLKMGYLWSPNGPLEAGIDGTIEIRDSVTEELTGCILRAQSKATTNPFPKETAERFEFPCDERDIEYWLRGNAPVILICSRIDTGDVYWKSIKDYFKDPERLNSRKIVFEKAEDRFDESAAAKLAKLAIPVDSGIYLAPRLKRETLYSNLLKVSSLPAKLYLAVTEHGSREEVREALGTYMKYPPREWVARSKTILSVHDLGTHPWSKIVDAGTVEEFDTAEWAESDDTEKRNDFVQLLNLCLTERLAPEHVRWSNKDHLYYIAPTRGLNRRCVNYRGLKKGASKEVFGPRKSKRDVTHTAYYRHSAFEGNFARYDGEWFLEIVPTYHFTEDGKKPSRFAAQRLQKIKQLERNPAILGQLFMWAHVLRTASAPLFRKPYPHLSFGDLVSFPIEVGIEDSEWLKQEEGDEHEALHAAGQELLEL